MLYSLVVVIRPKFADFCLSCQRYSSSMILLSTVDNFSTFLPFDKFVKVFFSPELKHVTSFDYSKILTEGYQCRQLLTVYLSTESRNSSTKLNLMLMSVSTHCYWNIENFENPPKNFDAAAVKPPLSNPEVFDRKRNLYKINNSTFTPENHTHIQYTHKHFDFNIRKQKNDTG